MGNDDRVLSQAEIDALLSSTAPAPKPAAPVIQQAKVSAAPPPPKVVAQDIKAVPPAQPRAAAPAPEPAAPAPIPAPAPQVINQGPTPEQVTNLCRQVASEQTKDIAKQIVELTIKVNKMDKLSQRLSQIEDKIDEMAEMVQQSPQAVEALSGRIEEICGLLEGLRRQHNKGDEERIRDQFHCVNCHSKKLVAVHVKCTSCGTENWMGWFPDKKESVKEDVQEHY